MKEVNWTDEQRQVESDLGVVEIRKRISELVPAELYETVVKFIDRDAYLTPAMADTWARLAAVLPAVESPWGGDVIRVHGTEIVRKRSMDELAQLVCMYELVSRDAAKRLATEDTPAEERG